MEACGYGYGFEAFLTEEGVVNRRAIRLFLDAKSCSCIALGVGVD